MSQIFDALQRSEAERIGKDPATGFRATELLERAERQTVSHKTSGEPPQSLNVALTPEPAIAVAEPARDTPTAVAAPHAAANTAAPRVDRVEGPMQCEVLDISLPPGSRLVSIPQAECAASEAFHLLGVRLRHLRRQRPLQKLVITSTIPEEGKSIVAANLACTLALRTQQKVLLLEGDVRRPTQSKIFGISQRQGICQWLSEGGSLLKRMYRLEGAGIWILPAGIASGNSLELLQSGRLTPMMEQLTSWFDWVVIDSPPILPLADTSVWTSMADGTMLVVRQGTTQKRQLQRGLEALGSQKLIGAVLNSAKSASNSDYYYRPTNRLPNEDAED